MTDDPRIRHVAWRNGRPRFSPSATLRAMGFEGLDLKAPDGRWMTAGQALDWSNALGRQIEALRRQQQRRQKHPPAAARPAAVLRAEALAPAYTLQQLFDDWLNLAQNPRLADLAEKTLTDYRQKARVFSRHLPDAWESEAAALTKPVCLGFYDALRARTSVRTAHGAMTILGIALQWAIDRGRLPDLPVNPAHKLKMKTPQPRVRFASREEMKVLVETADALGARDMGDMFTLAVWSGQRQADRIALTFPGRDQGRLTFRQNKTRVIVSIPEAPELQRRLALAQKRRQLAEVVSPFVALDEQTWQPFSGDRYRRRFQDIRRAAAKVLPTLATLRDQDLRDTAVTWLGMAGCTIPQICAITGHSFRTANEILKHYLALNPELADSAIAKMVSWYEQDEAN